MTRALSPIAAAALLAAALGCSKSEPTLILEVAPADAVVSVDGYAHPGSSPHAIDFKAPGRYLLTVSREGYRDVEMYVTLEPGERRRKSVELVALGAPIAVDPVRPDAPDEPPLPPPPVAPIARPPLDGGSFSLHVTSTPSGATVYLRDPSEPNERSAGPTPLSIDLPRRRPTEVTVRMRGYEEHRRIVVEPARGSSVNLDVSLAAEKGTASPSGPGPIEIVDPPPPAGSRGYLSVNTVPWTAVHVDGKAVGNTPVARIEVSAGRHTVLMENRDRGVRRKKTINVRPDEHVRLSEYLE